MYRTLLVISALAAIIVSRAAERAYGACQQAEFRVTSEAVQFDAMFLDDEGRPVTDLRKEEVTVSQDGRVVSLADLRFESRSMPKPSSTALPRPSVRAEESSDPEPWIFLIDDLAMSPDGFERARDGLLKFLQHDLPAGIEIGVLRTGELGARATQLSARRAALLREVGEMRYRMNRWRGGVMSLSGATGAGSVDGDRVFQEGTLGSLNSLLINLRQLPGRKVVIVISELVALTASDADVEAGGVLGVTPGGGYHTVAGRLRRLGRLAAEAGVTVHAVDVSGVTNRSSKQKVEADEGLRAVADELGGLYFGNSNEVGELMAKLRTVEQGHYVLTYAPPDGTFEDRGKPRFVTITVSVSRPGVRVRTRTGFFTR